MSDSSKSSKPSVPIWQAWLETLRSLPADAPEWDLSAEFIAELDRLTQIKLEERMSGIVQLNLALENMRTEASQAIEFFEMQDIQAWNAETVSREQAIILLDIVARLKENLLAYTRLDEQPVPTLKERVGKRNQLQKIEAQVQEVYQQAIEAFSQPAPEQAPNEPVPPDSQLVEDELPEPVSEEPLANEPGAPDLLEAAQPESTDRIEIAAPPTAFSELEVVEETATLEPTRSEEIVDIPPVEIPAANDFELPSDEPPGFAIELDEQENAENAPDQMLKEAQPAIEEIEESTPAEPAPTEEEDTEPDASDDGPILSQRIARRLTRKATDKRWQELVLALVKEDDLSGAYWLARSLEQQGIESPVPSFLLAALQGSLWLSPANDAFVMDLLELSQNIPDDQAYHELYGLAAALGPSLVAPQSGLIAWFKSQYKDPGLQMLAEEITRFAGLGIDLDEEIMNYVSGAVEASQSLAGVVGDAKKWLVEAPMRRIKFKRASDVWHDLVGKDGELRKMLKPVSEDKRSDVEMVNALCKRWSQREFVSEQIDDLDAKIFRLKRQPIVGPPRSQLVRDIEEACRLANRWCRMVQREIEIENRGDWIRDRVRELRDKIQALSPDIFATLNKQCQEHESLAAQAAACALGRSLLKLQQTLQIPASAVNNKSSTSWGWLTQNSSNLTIALNKRLLWMPELSITDEGALGNQDGHGLASALCAACAEQRTFGTIWQGWLHKQDYRFLDTLRDAAENEADAPDYQETLIKSRSLLGEQRADMITAIEQAVVDGIISDERAELSAKVEQVIPDQVLNFQIPLKSLEFVRIKLNEARRKRLADWQQDWEALQPRLNAYELAEPEKKRQLSKLIQAAFEREDTRLLDEYLARLSAALDLRKLQDEDWGQTFETRDDLSDFAHAITPLENWLKERPLEAAAVEMRDGAMRGGIKYGDVSVPRRAEALKAIDSWRQLKQLKTRTMSTTRGLMAYVLTYLGFALDATRPESVQVEKNGEDWLYAQVYMSAGNLNRPIPQFGSRLRGRYHVVCLWERPGIDTIYSRLLELRLNLDSVILLYFGRLTWRQRYDLVRMSTNQELAIAVLDDILMFFLAREQDARLPALLKCALPFAALNPYTPFQAGDVPPEMFFGRDQMVRDLQKADGSCLVYGGRQLGKSALLRQVQREFHNPGRQQYASVQDIKPVGAADQRLNTDTIWRKLRDCFKEFGLLPSQTRAERPEEIERLIREAMQVNQDRRVLVLFDEADNFLEADSRDSYRVTDMLRALMAYTSRRFKVVFAGLHNVQRFQVDPNQPLAHFGVPILIGPLDPKPATELIRLPLFFLGYRFADNRGPLRILSYTNYHPGLIQLFCQELLTRMRERSNNRQPPFKIEQADIEAVYYQVREHIRERFDWTLALDPAYQAIAWSMCEAQMQLRDGYSQAYAGDEILGMVRFWWPAFPNDLPILRSYLGEMVGLGVLVRDQAGSYRLRSPNLVRLMGTETEIGEQLLQLSNRRTAMSSPDTYALHAPLDDDASRYSPLTYAQEGDLNFRSHGVGLVFASDASGLGDIRKAFTKFTGEYEEHANRGAQEIPLYISHQAQLETWLDNFMQQNDGRDYLVAYHSLTSSSAEEIQEIVQTGLHYCAAKRTKKQTLRLFFLFDPLSTQRWLGLPTSLRQELEGQAMAVLYSKQWNLTGIRQRLEQSNMLYSDDVCNRMMEATGGWHVLLDIIFEQVVKRKKDDPRELAGWLVAELDKPGSPNHQHFQQALGLDGKLLEQQIFRFILECASQDGKNSEPVPIEFITPEMMGDPKLTLEQCQAGLEFLMRMGCVRLDGEYVQVDPLVGKALTSQ